LIPQTDNDAREMHELLEEIVAENLRRMKYPELKLIKISLLRRRVADYLTRRREADDNIERREKETGRRLSLAEARQFEGRLNSERKALTNDLRHISAGFEFGTGQLFSVAGEYDVFMDEATGILPPEYNDLAKKMSRLSKRERYQLINNLLDEETIDEHQHSELVRLFIEDIPDEKTCDIGLKGDPVLTENINPKFCPYSHKRPNGTIMCEFQSEDNEDADGDNETVKDVDGDDEYTSDKNNDSSLEHSDSDDVSVEDDGDSYDYSFDVDDASSIDVDFDGNSASFDFDYDGGDYDGGDYGGGGEGGGDGGD
jgi:hypothetical protein